MTGRNRKFALLLAAALCIIMLFSLSFVSEEADHKCSAPGECPVCYQINISENALKKLSAVAVLSVIVVFLRLTAEAAPLGAVVCSVITLVSLKVKLSN